MQVGAFLKTMQHGGERGIRTLGTLARTTVFETAPFNHSGTSPSRRKTPDTLRKAH
jgi:hypothetical protein